VVELRIAEALLTGCKTVSNIGAPVAQDLGYSGCYEPQTGGGGSIFLCRDNGS